MDRATAFWSRVDTSGEGCWEWRLRPESTGYCHFVFQGKRQYAHRVAWELTCGPIPPGLLVCHTCDNRKCTRPSHLFLGTHADNAMDRMTKGRGRAARGEQAGHAKLTESEVRAIRTAPGSNRLTGLRYGIGAAQVSRIRNYKRWAHVPPQEQLNELHQMSGGAR